MNVPLPRKLRNHENGCLSSWGYTGSLCAAMAHVPYETGPKIRTGKHAHTRARSHTHRRSLSKSCETYKSFACIHFRSPPPSEVITLCLSPCCRSGKLNTDKTNLIINDLSPEDSASYTCSLAVAGQTVTHTLTVEGEVFFLI